MVFSSLLFLTIFLPLFLLVYKLLPNRTPVRNAFVLASSFFFYAWGEPKFVFAVFFTTIIDFYLVRKMSRCEGNTRRLFLTLSIVLNAGLLFYFKYFNFFTDNLSVIAHWLGQPGLKVARIALPIGISFFIFESITYAMDVYRKTQQPLESFWKYQTYIIFFPKLIAGPIVRYHEIAPQINDRSVTDTRENSIAGFVRFCIGLSKKVFIANAMAAQADAIFSLKPGMINTEMAWIGALAYTFQIYFDFSGYSDMAIGLGRMMGFTIPENFNNPYISQHITEFWRRWHITLGRWMKNYLYIPLGGNRVSSLRLLMNLFIVFVVSGLWHGASWTFVFWGIYHGIFLVIERLLKVKESTSPLKYIRMLYAFIVVMVGWVFFRMDNLKSAFVFIGKMFSADFSHPQVFLLKPNFTAMAVLAFLFSICTLNRHVENFHDHLFYAKLSHSKLSLMFVLALCMYFLSIVYLSGGEYNPFIYFKF